MKSNKYHHGNLRNELIEAGLKIINEEGVEHLSLRKAATMCSVSHAAPKSHFENKEAFVEAIKQQVTMEFSKAMEDVVVNNSDSSKLIMEFGLAYIQYFVEHPDSFLFITNQNDLDIRISKDRVWDSSYAPFQIFQSHASRIFLDSGMPEEQLPATIISLWAFVNGLAGLSVMKGFHYEGNWMEMVEKIMCSDKEGKR